MSGIRVLTILALIATPILVLVLTAPGCDQPEPTDYLVQLDTPGFTRDLALVETTLVVADGPGGLRFVDVDTPTKPQVLGQFATAGSANCVAVEGKMAVVGMGYAGLVVVDFSDPRNPVQLGRYDLKNVRDILVRDALAFCAADQLVVLDLSDPAAPVVVFQEEVRQPQQLALAGSYLLRVRASPDSPGTTFELLDFTDPAAPELVCTVRFGELVTARNLAVTGNRAYVAGSGAVVTRRAAASAWLNALDISNPVAVAKLWQTPFSGRAVGLAVAQDELLLATDTGWLMLADLRDTDNVRWFGSVPFADPYDLLLHDGFAFGARGASGVSIIDLTFLRDSSLGF
ncbi:MAG: hypothetical protein ABIF77_16835 [bacterium]